MGDYADFSGNNKGKRLSVLLPLKSLALFEILIIYKLRDWLVVAGIFMNMAMRTDICRINFRSEILLRKIAHIPSFLHRQPGSIFF